MQKLNSDRFREFSNKRKQMNLQRAAVTNTIYSFISEFEFNFSYADCRTGVEIWNLVLNT